MRGHRPVSYTHLDVYKRQLLTETITDYMYPSASAPVMSDAGKAVSELKDSLEAAKDDDEFFQAVAGFYQKYGTGIIGINRAFTVKVDEKGTASLRPVVKTEDIKLSDLIGYELQKQRLTANTVAFIEKKPANNVLLYGDVYKRQTYTIAGQRGSGMICLNGAAARCVQKGDKIIIMCYALMSGEEIKENPPKVVFVDDNNKVSRVSSYEKHGQLGV